MISNLLVDNRIAQNSELLDFDFDHVPSLQARLGGPGLIGGNPSTG
jgi:hypothetical protein